MTPQPTARERMAQIIYEAQAKELGTTESWAEMKALSIKQTWTLKAVNFVYVAADAIIASGWIETPQAEPIAPLLKEMSMFYAQSSQMDTQANAASAPSQSGAGTFPLPSASPPSGVAERDEILRCNICGFVIDQRYEAEKPKINDFMTGNRKPRGKDRPQDQIDYARKIVDAQSKPYIRESAKRLCDDLMRAGITRTGDPVEIALAHIAALLTLTERETREACATGWTIEKSLTSDVIDVLTLARRTLRKCPAVVHLIENGFDGTHHADIMIRADGQDYHAEGDWARWALRLLRKIAFNNGVRSIPDGDKGTFPLNPVNTKV